VHSSRPSQRGWPRSRGSYGGDTRQWRRAAAGIERRYGLCYSRAAGVHLASDDARAWRPRGNGDPRRRRDPRARGRGRSRGARCQPGPQPCERGSIVPQLAGRFQTLPEYPLATIPQRKRALVERGVDVIDLGAGDADLGPPAAALDALSTAARVPAMSRYGFGLGLVAFREAVAAWMGKRFGLRFDPLTEIVPLIGSKEGIAHLALAYLEPGRIAIIPEPGYNAYQGGTLLASGEPYRYALRPRTDFLVDLDEIPEVKLRQTRILYLNYPNNPTAAVAPVEYLQKVVRRCRELDIL